MHRLMARLLLLSPFLAPAAAGAQSPQTGQSPAAAPPAQTSQPRPPASMMSTLLLTRCRRMGAHQSGGAWMCPGLPGYDIYLSEGDLRQMIAYGDNARQQRAATQTLAPFNSVFKGRSDRTIVMWRGQMQAGRFVPYASIIRYFTDEGDSGQGPGKHGQVLIVSKVGPSNGTEACHVAYIDALANKSANALAVKAADELAPTYDCRKEPTVVGLRGKSPMLANTKT